MVEQLKVILTRTMSVLALVSLFSILALAQTPYRITYRLAMSQPSSHLFEVSINVEATKGQLNNFIDFQMPKWSPGRYSVCDFAKNVQEFRAVIGECPNASACASKPLPSSKIDDQTWRVRTLLNRSLTVSYKVFGNNLSGTFAQLNNQHANYNGGEIFMYLVRHKADPVRLTIKPPAEWRIINAQTNSPEQSIWQFPNYDLLIDTPTEISPAWTMDEFNVAGKAYRVVIHSLGDEGDKRPKLVQDIEKIVRAGTEMWGVPDFDTYTFLIHFAADDRSDDGMEHLNSTQIISPGALSDSGVYEDTLDTVAHEFIHVWNVKRLRPIALGPWDFTHPANTKSLWIAEGFTNYYGHLLQRRAGIWDDARLLTSFSRQIRRIEDAPGSRLISAEDASMAAPFTDNAPPAQRTNLANTSISYYAKGEVIALVLDLMVRGKTHNHHSLDEVMRKMYQKFYLDSPKATYYLKGRGYTDEDFERVASEVTEIDLSDFFTQYVRGVNVLPYNEALAQVGLQLTQSLAPEPYTAGILLDGNDKQNAKIRSVRSNSAAEHAGLEEGDVILTINDESVTSENWKKVLNKYKQGDRMAISVKRDRKTISTFLIPGQPEAYTYSIEEKPNATPTMRQMRMAWMSGHKN